MAIPGGLIFWTYPGVLFFWTYLGVLLESEFHLVPLDRSAGNSSTFRHTPSVLHHVPAIVTVRVLTMLVILVGMFKACKGWFWGEYGFVWVYSCVSLASPWSGAWSDLRKKFLNSLSSGMCGSTKAPPLYTDLQDFNLRSSRPRVPISQVGSRGSRVFLRCSATATTSAASRTNATTGRLWRRERRNPSTAGPMFTCGERVGDVTK